MPFIKDRIIYESKRSKVYINQMFNPGKKTKKFAIRRDDNSGKAMFMGNIYFSGAWRQYITEFESGTIWSAGCKQEIVNFENEINKQWREKVAKRKKCPICGSTSTESNENGFKCKKCPYEHKKVVSL